MTKSPTGVQQYAWRPGASNEIAYVASDEAPKVTGEERHNRAFEIQNNHFLLQEAPRPAHVWLIAADGKSAARRLTSGAWTLPVSLPPSAPSSPLSWSPDGKRLAIVKVATSLHRRWRQEPQCSCSTSTPAICAPLTGRTRNESQPMFSPDGSRIAHWYPRDGENRNVNEIYVGPANGGDTASVTRALDRNVQRVIWMPDGKSMLVSANDGTTTGLWIQPLDGAARRIDMGKVVATAAFWLDASVGPKGEIALTGSEPERPAELYYLASPDSSAGAPHRLQPRDRHARTGPVRNRAVGFRRLPHGRRGHLPARLRARRRSIRWCSTFTAARGRRPSRPSPAARNCSPRRAGSSSSPTTAAATTWATPSRPAIWNDAGAGPGRDVMAGVAALEKRGFVDTAKMAVSGWSYGGYMTTWLLGNYPDEWKAAVAGAAVTDWLDQYNYGDANVRRGSAFGGSPYTDAKRMQAYREQSPIYYASKIQAPTLILSDTGDFRVPITQSFQLYHALRRQRRADAVHRLPGIRPQPERPGALPRHRPPLDRLAGEISVAAIAAWAA